MKQNSSILIIGAGISGITLASKLVQEGRTCTLLEKSAGLGGRLATRRHESGKWDHGLPFVFEKQVPREDWTVWSSLTNSVSNFEPKRFISPDGFTSIPKHLARNLTVIKNTRIIKIILNGTKPNWILLDELGRTFEGDILVLTCPVPQSLELLEKSDLLDSCGVKDSLSKITYRPHLVVLGVSQVPLPNIFESSIGSPIELLVENGLKGIKESRNYLTCYLDEDFSRSEFENPDGVTLDMFRATLQKKANLSFRHLELKKWRYSRVKQFLTEPYLMGHCPAPIYFTGDGFGGGDLDGALRSAHLLSSHFTK